MNSDLVFGGAAFALAVGYYLMTRTIPTSLLADAIGPQGLPKIYAMLLAGLSLLLMIRSIAAGSASKVSRAVSPQTLWRVGGLLAIGVVYVLSVPWLGYMLSLAVLIMATTYYQGGALDRRGVGVAVSGAVVFWLLFVLLLGIPQPAGLWPSLL
jgi:putative tricarboxylic transport membrane protein